MVTGGLFGIIVARCVSGLVSIIVAMTMVRRILGISMLRQLSANIRFIVGVVVMVICAYLVGVCFGNGAGTNFLLLKVAAIVSVGAIAYPLTVYTFWHLQGRPEGPEREVIELVTALLPNRFRTQPLAGDNSSVL